MEQNAQSGAFYPPAAFNLPHLAFTSSEELSPFLSSGYPAPPYVSAPPSAPSSASQGFYMTDSVQVPENGKPHEERETCNIVTMAASDSTMKTNADNLFQAFDSISKRLSQLENTVQGLECSIEGLKRAEKEKYNECNDKLSRLELLIKEVLTSVQHLSESQKLDRAVSQMRKLDRAMSQMRKLQVVDEKASVGEQTQKPSMERWRHPNESCSYVEPSDTSEHMTQHVPVLPLQPYYPEAPPPPQSQSYAAPHSVLPPSPSMSEPGKSTIQHPYAPPLPPCPPPLPPINGQLLPPHHAMQAPLFAYQAQAHASLPTLPPQGLSNPSVDTTSDGPIQLHQQYREPPMLPSNSYSEIPTFSFGPSQKVPHSSAQYGSSRSHVYKPVAGMIGGVSPYVQSWSQTSPPPSIYEMTNNTGYDSSSLYKAAQPVPSSTSGGGSHSSLPKVQPALPTSNGMAFSSAFASRHQKNDVTETVIAMGFSREQVSAVVQGLTEVGQPVDMNTVLDKIMNRGESPQPPRGWYSRG